MHTKKIGCMFTLVYFVVNSDNVNIIIYDIKPDWKPQTQLLPLEIKKTNRRVLQEQNTQTTLWYTAAGLGVKLHRPEHRREKTLQTETPLSPHSFIPGLKPSFSANPSLHSLPFLLQDWFPGPFADTSKQTCFYFFCFLLFICWFREVN